MVPILTLCEGPANECGRAGREDLAEDEPVEEFSEGGELLLDGGGGDLGCATFDPGGDVNGLDLDELVDAAGILAPGEEACRGAGVGGAGVRIAELGCEELQVASGGLWAVVVDEGGKEGAAGCV